MHVQVADVTFQNVIEATLVQDAPLLAIVKATVMNSKVSALAIAFKGKKVSVVKKVGSNQQEIHIPDYLWWHLLLYPEITPFEL